MKEESKNINEKKISDFFNEEDSKENSKVKRLCLQLAYSDSEEEVIKHLKDAGYWDDFSVWRDYGDLENNYSIIGNQQSSADTALVEKIVNSVDAMLMRESLRRKIDPKGPDAPKSISEALESFFEIPGGNLANISSIRRRDLAENIALITTGEKKKPCYSIVDKGEGQRPQDIPFTFLSLVRRNKVEIPFVQGRFDMGSTGSLPFCGDNQLQLIITKRDPKLLKDDENPESIKWSFTIVRRFDPIGNMKNSVFRYLAPNNKVLSFDAISLPLLPREYPTAYEKPLYWGSFVKLYDYQIANPLKGVSILNLYFRLSLLIPSIPLPVKIFERRKSYKEGSKHKYLHTVLNGLSVRLEENKYNDIEEGFPTSGEIVVNKQKLKVTIYALKAGIKPYTRDRYTGRGQNSIIFTFNGQAHGFFTKSFLERKKVNMSYLSDSLVIIVDCSLIEQRTHERLFMNSRDRLYDKEIKREIEKKLEKMISEHPGLRELRNRRRFEATRDKLAENKPLRDVIEQVITKSPTLTQLFVHGKKISDPFDLRIVGTASVYKGKEYPTYFKLKKIYPEDKPKNAMIRHSFRIEYETDANNDYFSRDSYPGKFDLMFENGDGFSLDEYRLSLWNGKAILSVYLPQEIEVGEKLLLCSSVSDIKRIEPFKENFYVKVIEEKIVTSGPKGERSEPPGDFNISDREKPSLLNLPNIILVYENEWEIYGFNKESALLVRKTEEQGYDFYINMSNIYLNTEIKSNPKIEPEVLQEQFKVANVLIGLSLLHSYEKQRIALEEEDIEEDEEFSIYDDITRVTRVLSPILIPMISTLSEVAD